ncbi:MAG: hypothetical protein HLX50_11305 [Alteromonadaceae bacterium]|nr:hypothetical protein [Alteromonadaceae bacterium]
MRKLLTTVYIVIMAILLIFHGGPKSEFSYSEWKTIVVKGKSRTPQGLFSIDDGKGYLHIAVPNKAARSFWYRVKDFNEVSVRLVSENSIAALKFRGEIVYGIEEYEAAVKRTKSSMEDQMLMVSAIYIILLGFFNFNERR